MGKLRLELDVAVAVGLLWGWEGIVTDNPIRPQEVGERTSLQRKSCVLLIEARHAKATDAHSIDHAVIILMFSLR